MGEWASLRNIYKEAVDENTESLAAGVSAEEAKKRMKAVKARIDNEIQQRLISLDISDADRIAIKKEVFAEMRGK